MLPAMLWDGKRTFPRDLSPVRKVCNAVISKHTRETLCHILDEYKDIISSSSSDTGSTKFIEMDTKTDPHYFQ